MCASKEMFAHRPPPLFPAHPPKLWFTFFLLLAPLIIIWKDRTELARQRANNLRAICRSSLEVGRSVAPPASTERALITHKEEQMLNHNCSYEVKRETLALHIFSHFFIFALMEDVASSFRPLPAFCVFGSLLQVWVYVCVVVNDLDVMPWQRGTDAGAHCCWLL